MFVVGGTSRCKWLLLLVTQTLSFFMMRQKKENLDVSSLSFFLSLLSTPSTFHFWDLVLPSSFRNRLFVRCENGGGGGGQNHNKWGERWSRDTSGGGRRHIHLNCPPFFYGKRRLGGGETLLAQSELCLVRKKRGVPHTRSIFRWKIASRPLK